MRPRERDEDPTPEPIPAPAPPRAAGGLSSMVVRPPENGGSADFEAAEGVAPIHHRSPPSDLRRRGSPSVPVRRGSPPPFRRPGSPPSFYRRGSPPHRHGSPPAFHRRGSPPAFPHRFPPAAVRHRGASPPDFHPRSSQRFSENPVFRVSWLGRKVSYNEGYGIRRGGGSITPPPRRQRLEDSRFDPHFDRAVGPPRGGRGIRGGRGGGRFRDVSPRDELERGGGDRSFGRGYGGPARVLSPPFDGEYVHRNDPNLSPREGDWICRNPSCGNLNFARRTQCNNCNKFRYGPGVEEAGSLSPPQKGYFDSYKSPPPKVSIPPPKDMGGRYESVSPPRRGWGPTNARDMGARSPPPPQRGRFPYHMRRESPDYAEEEEYRPMHGSLVDRRDHRRRDGPSPDSRVVYMDRRRALSPRDRWARDSRERMRSRSPMGNRPPLKGGPFIGGRRSYDDDDSFARDNYDPDGGRRYRHGDTDSFGRGRGGRRVMTRGRNSGGMY